MVSVILFSNQNNPWSIQTKLFKSVGLYPACYNTRYHFFKGNRSHISRKQIEKAVEEIVADGNPTGMFEVNFDKLCDLNRAKADAKNLFKAGEDRWGTDEETFIRIFACRDYYQLRATYNEYVKV